MQPAQVFYVVHRILVFALQSWRFNESTCPGQCCQAQRYDYVTLSSAMVPMCHTGALNSLAPNSAFEFDMSFRACFRGFREPSAPFAFSFRGVLAWVSPRRSATLHALACGRPSKFHYGSRSIAVGLNK